MALAGVYEMWTPNDAEPVATFAILMPDARRLFTERHALYSRFIRAVRYPQGLRGSTPRT